MRQQASRAVTAVPLATAGAALATLPVLYVVDPNKTHVPLCPLHALTGLNCPLCGATRATYELLHGNLVTALHDNALYVLSIPFLLLLWYRWFSDARSEQPGARLAPRWMTPAVIGLAILFAVVRNLWFGSWLSPPV